MYIHVLILHCFLSLPSLIALKITVGRIAALFSYCYHLCKVYMERNGVKVGVCLCV